MNAAYCTAKARYNTLNAAHLKAQADCYRIQSEMASVDPDKLPEAKMMSEAFYLNLAFNYDRMAKNAAADADEWAREAVDAARDAA